MKTKRIPIVIPPALLADIESMAAASGATRAELVKGTLAEAVARYLAEHSAPANLIPFPRA